MTPIFIITFIKNESRVAFSYFFSPLVRLLSGCAGNGLLEEMIEQRGPESGEARAR